MHIFALAMSKNGFPRRVADLTAGAAEALKCPTMHALG
jgi:hypothetical protein